MPKIEKKIRLRRSGQADMQASNWPFSVKEEWQNIIDAIGILTPSTGTFTPEIADAPTGGNTGTATTANGFYSLIGDIVFISIVLQGISTSGMTGANQVYIRNLPYSINSRSVGSVSLNNITLTGNNGYVSQVRPAIDCIEIKYLVTGSVAGSVIVSEINSGTGNIFLSISYEVV